MADNVKHRISVGCSGCPLEFVSHTAQDINEALEQAVDDAGWDFVGDDGRLVCKDCCIQFVDEQETGPPPTDDSSDVW